MIAEAELLKEQGRNTVQLVLHYADLVSTITKSGVSFFYDGCNDSCGARPDSSTVVNDFSRHPALDQWPLITRFQLVTNPKTFVQETKAIWERLSMEGPQDLQEPPETVHQLIEILFDEGIRRFVRATNSVVRNVHEVAACAKHVIGYIVVMADKRFKVFRQNNVGKLY